MTMSNLTNAKAYAGDGSTTEFSFPFKLLQASDLKVIRILASDYTSRTTLTQGTGTNEYQVTINTSSEGGSITLGAGAAAATTSSYILVIYRDPSATQSTDIPPLNPLPEEDIENTLDRLTMLFIDISEKLNNTPRIHEHVTDGVEFRIDVNAADRASKTIGFNEDGTEVLLYDNPDTVATSAAAAAASATAASSSASSSASSATASAASAAAAAASEDAAQIAAAAATSVSVLTLGCVADGITDDQPAIQAALAAGYRNFYIPDGATVYCANPIKLSGNTTSDGSSFVYSGVTFQGANPETSKIIFGNHGSSYVGDDTMPVGFQSFYSTPGVELSGCTGLTVRNLEILGPQYGCTFFFGNSRDIFMDNCRIGTNGSNIVKYCVWGKATIRVKFNRTRFAGSYVAQCHIAKADISGRSTNDGSPQSFNDSWCWISCHLTGNSYAAILDSGSQTEGTRVIMDCVFSTASRYYGYLGGRGVNVTYIGNWDEYGRCKVGFPNVQGAPHTAIPYLGSAISGVVDPTTMYIDDYFTGGWAYSFFGSGNHFQNGRRDFDMTNVQRATIENNVYSNYDDSAIEVNHIYTESGAISTVVYNDDHSVGTPSTATLVEVRDQSGNVQWNKNYQTSMTAGATTQRSSVRYESHPLKSSNEANNAGASFTRHSDFKAVMKLDVSQNGTFIPMMRIAGSLFSGPLKVTIATGGAGIGGGVVAYQEILMDIAHVTSLDWTIRDVKVLRSEMKQGTHYSSTNEPQFVYGMIGNAGGLVSEPVLFVGVQGLNHSANSVTMTVEGQLGFNLNEDSVDYLMHPNVTYIAKADADTEITTAEAANAGTTIANTTMAVYKTEHQTADIAISAAGTATEAHGLIGTPTDVQAFLRCVTAEAGYTAGQIVAVPAGYSTGNTGFTALVDSTNVTVRMGSAAAPFAVAHATTGVGTALTNANWSLFLIVKVKPNAI